MDVIQTIAITGFDSKGDPEIRVLNDGTLYVVFNFMPPSDFEDGEMGPYQDFDKQMSAATGVLVHWEDREFFRVDSPREDTISLLVSFVSGYRSRSKPTDRHKFGSKGTCFEEGCSGDHPFAVGQRIQHFLFGEGEVINFDGHGDDARIRVRFADGVKWMITNDPTKLWPI